MRPLLPLVLAGLALGCARSAPPEAAAPPVEPTPPVRQVPAPLAERPFELPDVQRVTLPNGLIVLVVPNHEVPLWDARVVFRAGAYEDPEGKEGLSAVTFAMLNEGAGGRDASALARELKRLGGVLGAGAGADSASVTVGGPKRNLAPLMGLLADVVLRPDFPQSEWDLMQRRRIADLRASLENPDVIAGRVLPRLVYGPAYRGRLTSEAAYRAIGVRDMRAHHQRVVRPDQAVLLVGGDVTLEEIRPEVERAFGAWRARGPAPRPPQVTARHVDAETIYLVDRPGAAQSVVQAVVPVNDRHHEDYWDLFLANTAFGGAFTARVNMNLREEKGWTYGARCGLDDGLGATLWTCSTSVQTDKTIPALLELRREVREVVDARPITDDEVRFFQSFRVNAFYGRYETPGSLLGQLADVWIHGLGEDWLERYVPGIQAVTTGRANSAIRKWIEPGRVAWVIVGDEARIREQLAGTDLELVRIDRDAALIPGG